MPRKNPPRRHARGMPAIAGSLYQCIGCPARVSDARICCVTCWGRLPRRIRDRLRPPYGESAHGCKDVAYRQAIQDASAYLSRGRELTEAGRSTG